jgi:hypothetical protein
LNSLIPIKFLIFYLFIFIMEKERLSGLYSHRIKNKERKSIFL